MEHALAAEGASRVDAVETSDERAVAPGLDAVSVPQPMHLLVRQEHLLGDPGPLLVGARNLGARTDDASERSIDRELESALATGTGEVSAHVEVGEVENRTLPRAVPEQGETLARPGEHAASVCCEQRVGRQRAAYRDDVVELRGHAMRMP